MTPKPRPARPPRPSRRDPAHCELTVHIHNHGGVVNIYNCPPELAPPPAPTPAADLACLPTSADYKPKQSRQTRLQTLLARRPVPSALAAAFFASARRHQAGEPPTSPLEQATFRALDRLDPELQPLLACALDAFDQLPAPARRLFADLGPAPLTTASLGAAVAAELLTRTHQLAAADECAGVERPGLARYIRFTDDVGINYVGVCKVNGLRTSAFLPRLRLGDYTPDEVQQQCTLEVVNNVAQLNCEVQTSDCPGNQFEGTCLRVPEVAPGAAVFLEGYNFFNTAARVRLEAKPPGVVSREVDAFVCGDLETPLTEVIDGQTRTIADCRVHDHLSFVVPADLPAGIYGMRVVFANNSGDERFGPLLESYPPQYIQVIPSVADTFQIASEELKAIDETSPSWWGSDEVGLRFVVIPVDRALTPGPAVSHAFRFDDVDSGDTRTLERLLFQGSNFGGVSLAVLGFEVDSESAYEKQIHDFTDAYVDVLSSQWNLIATAVGTAGGIAAGAAGLSYAWSLAIAAAITFAIDVFVALWAPADLIMEDAFAFTPLDLATRLSPNYPPPPVSRYTTAGDIEVKVEPVSKDVQYREFRTYRSDDEGSKYRLTLRYNRS